MFNLPGARHRYCDGLSRRSFLQVGALGLGGLALPDLLRAEGRSGKKSHKSVIMVYLSGGLAHQDSFDLKPNAPQEVRGDFKPIPTNVPGMQISEHLPRLARCADKYSLIRSIVGLRDEHSSFQNMTGYGMDQTKRENRAHMGSVIARKLGPADDIVPAFVDLFPTMQHKPYNSPGAGILGRAATPTKLDGGDLDAMKLQAMSVERLHERRDLLGKINSKDTSRSWSAMDTYYERAFEVLTSNKLVDALDVTKEPEKTRDRYGRGSPKHQGDGGPQWNDQLLMARRLVEAGARVVTVAYGFWDTHGNNFTSLKRQLPLFDQGISALVEDIHARGMDKDTTVLVWGEFGRTPKINKDAGRDHWAPVNGCLFAGGGMKMGQVIGSTDSTAGQAKDTPIHYLDILATVYRNLGIDPHSMVYDIAERPTPILPDSARPVQWLF